MRAAGVDVGKGDDIEGLLGSAIAHGAAEPFDLDAAANKVEDGTDTFIFRDGQIRLQTVRYTLQHTS